MDVEKPLYGRAGRLRYHTPERYTPTDDGAGVEHGTELLLPVGGSAEHGTEPLLPVGGSVIGSC